MAVTVKLTIRNVKCTVKEINQKSVVAIGETAFTGLKVGK